MKVGILTHYNVNNQGAQLQMYAMMRWLEAHGHEPVVLTYEKNFDFDKQEARKNSGSFRNLGYYCRYYLLEKGFGLTLFNMRKVFALRKAFEKVKTAPYDRSGCDVIVIGSDEVFSIDVGFNRMMYGYGLGSTPAIAYAPAFGRTTEDTLREYQCYDLVKHGLSDMYALSARDDHTQNMILSLTHREVPVVCDPVIMYDGKDFLHPVKPLRKKYMLVYSYDRHMIDPDEVHEIRAYAKKHGLITASVGTYHKWCDRNIVCSAEEWFNYFRNAECVLTDTFHGSVVAIKNHCNVAVFVRQSINAFKMESLLAKTGLEDRRLTALTAAELNRVLSCSINYKAVDRKLADMASFSEAYLVEKLEKLDG